MTTRQIGTEYENRAIVFLQDQGLQLQDRNFRLDNSEVDLIFSDDEQLIFVEVKYRRTQHFADILEQLTAAQLQRVRHAARVWMIKNNINEHEVGCRFDIVAITGEPFQVEWLKDAF